MRSTTCSLARKMPLWRQHGVHQRGLAVVDVRNDGDIAREAIMLLRFAMIGRVTQDFRLHSDTYYGRTAR